MGVSISSCSFSSSSGFCCFEVLGASFLPLAEGAAAATFVGATGTEVLPLIEGAAVDPFTGAAAAALEDDDEVAEVAGALDAACEAGAGAGAGATEGLGFGLGCTTAAATVGTGVGL